MSMQAVPFDFEKQSYIPDAVTFSLVSMPLLEHDVLIKRYEDVNKSMQRQDVEVGPAKIESILRVIVLYTAYRDTTLFLPEMKPRDVDIIARAFSRLLSQHETRLEQAINNLVGLAPNVTSEHCLQLGRALTQISTRQQTNPTIANAKKLFSKAFANHIIKPEVVNLHEWVIILLQTHPKLVWLKQVVKKGLSDDKLKAIVCCFQTQHKDNSDVKLFLCAYDAYRLDFTQAHTLFWALQPQNMLPTELSSEPLITFLKRYIPACDKEHVKKVLLYLIGQKASTWLDSLCDQSAPDIVVEYLEELFNSHEFSKNREIEAINLRFQQIARCRPALSKIDQLRIAIWSEIKIPNRFETKKYLKAETGLVVDILYDVYGDLYLILDNISSLKLPFTRKQEASWVSYTDLAATRPQ